MTHTEMMAIVPNEAWADGREGFVWCRFDLMIGGNHHLRAEITWDDKEDENGQRVSYHDPQLRLETNRLIRDDMVHKELRTVADVRIDITEAQAIWLLTGPPTLISTTYSKEIDALKKRRLA